MQDLALLCSRIGAVYPNSGAPLHVLQDVSFEVRRNEFLSFVGPSGCGKTTLLRILAGLSQPSDGDVEMWNAPEDRPATSVVFQENSLFPWMTVLENAAFGLEMQKIPKAERNRRATDLLARFGLRGREGAYPHQLSTGMKQRVAVTRAFLSGAPVLLMDEPFGALDCQSRLLAQRELMEIWRQDRKTVVFVTHDVGEAVMLSDRVLVLSPSPGRIIAEYDVPLPRPRSEVLEDDEEMIDLKRRIFGSLHLTSEIGVRAGAR